MLSCSFSSLGSAVLASPSTLPRVHAAAVQAWFGPGFLVPLRHISGVTLSPNLVWRENHGGRKYPTYSPGYEGPIIVGEKRWRAVRKPGGVLLPAVPREKRCEFRAQLGTTYIDVDIDQCFPSILAAISGDEALAAACLGDLHQVSGDLLLPRLPAERRRSLGKLFNLSVLGGVTKYGWARHLRASGVPVKTAEADEMLTAWWGRFPAALSFRDRWRASHHAAASRKSALQVTLPAGRRFRFSRYEVLGVAHKGGPVTSGTPESRLRSAARTSLSSVFRGTEGLILDLALQQLYGLRGEGLRLVLPMYDGVLLRAPEEVAAELAAKVEDVFEGVLRTVGVEATVSTKLKPSWG